MISERSRPAAWTTKKPVMLGIRPAAGRAMRGEPNTMIPRSLSLLANEDLMITASSATGLITTPDAWQPSPALGKMEVETLAILSADFSRVRFSTWLPTVEPGVTVVVGPENRMLILGSSVAKDLSRTAGVDVPMISPLQETFGSGASDAFIALVEEK